MNSNCPVEFVAADSNDSPFSGLHVLVPVPSKLSRVILHVVTSFRLFVGLVVSTSLLAFPLPIDMEFSCSAAVSILPFSSGFAMRRLCFPGQCNPAHMYLVSLVSRFISLPACSPQINCVKDGKTRFSGLVKNEKYSRLCLFLIPTQPREIERQARMTQRHRMTARGRIDLLIFFSRRTTRPLLTTNSVGAYRTLISILHCTCARAKKHKFKLSPRPSPVESWRAK